MGRPYAYGIPKMLELKLDEEWDGASRWAPSPWIESKFGDWSDTPLWFNRANGRRIWSPDTEVVGGHTVPRHPMPNCRTTPAGMKVEVVKL
jgi:hypothetical protein